MSKFKNSRSESFGIDLQTLHLVKPIQWLVFSSSYNLLGINWILLFCVTKKMPDSFLVVSLTRMRYLVSFCVFRSKYFGSILGSFQNMHDRFKSWRRVFIFCIEICSGVCVLHKFKTWMCHNRIFILNYICLKFIIATGLLLYTNWFITYFKSLIFL